MAFTETPKEKTKRLAFYAKNQADAKDREAKSDAETMRKFNETTNVDTSKNTNPAGDTFKKGGKVMKKAKCYEDGGEVEFESKTGPNKSIDGDTRIKALDYANSKLEDEPMIDMRPAPKKASAPKAAAKSTPKFSSADTGGGAAVTFRKQSAPKAASAKPAAKKDSYTPDHSMGAAMKRGGKVKKMASGGKVAGKLATRGYGIAKK